MDKVHENQGPIPGRTSRVNIVRRSVLAASAFALAFCATIVSGPRMASACCSCYSTASSVDAAAMAYTVRTVNRTIESEFRRHRRWFGDVYWEDNILPALMQFAGEMTSVAMYQAAIFGALLDAKHQLETERIFQKLTARAHKDYHTSLGMCEVASAAQSLAASERIGEYDAIALAQRSLDRQLGSPYSAAFYGSDIASRVQKFKTTYCDVRDQNNGLAELCDHDGEDGGDAGGTDPQRLNRDIDYARLFAEPWTINANFTNTALTADEEDILALSSNLYSIDVLSRVSSDQIQTLEDRPFSALQEAYLDARSVVAKRSVAENSFNAVMAMKAAGSPSSRTYLRELLIQMGVPDEPIADSAISEVDALIGENPSYYAQMEILTKKLYQTPDFYTNLYDKPANVRRKGVAMQAIALMQKFDTFKSYLRTEQELSLLLELDIAEMQEAIENTINSGNVTGANN